MSVRLSFEFTRRFRIFLRVIIAVMESEPALINHSDLLFGIVRVLARSSGKEDASPTRANLKPRNQFDEVARCAKMFSGSEVNLDSLDTWVLNGWHDLPGQVQMANLIGVGV